MVNRTASKGADASTKNQRLPFKGKDPQADPLVPEALIKKLKAQLGDVRGCSAIEVESALRRVQPKAASVLEEKGLLGAVAERIAKEEAIQTPESPAPSTPKNRVSLVHPGADAEAETRESISKSTSFPEYNSISEMIQEYRDLKAKLKGISDRDERIALASNLANSMRRHFEHSGSDIQFRMHASCVKRQNGETLDTEDLLASALMELESYLIKQNLKALGYQDRPAWVRLLSESQTIEDSKRTSAHDLVNQLERLERIASGGGESALSKEASSASVTSANVQSPHETKEEESPVQARVWWPFSWQNLPTIGASAATYGVLWLSSSGFSSTASGINGLLGTDLRASDANLYSIALLSIPVVLELVNAVGNVSFKRKVSKAGARALDAFKRAASIDGYEAQVNELSRILKSPENRRLMLSLDYFREDSGLASIARGAGLHSKLKDNIYTLVDICEAEIIAGELSPIAKKDGDGKARLAELTKLLHKDPFLRAKVEELCSKDGSGQHEYGLLRARVLEELAKILEESARGKSADVIRARAEGEARVLLTHLEGDFQSFMKEEEE